MKKEQILTCLVLGIIVLSIGATLSGILSSDGPGEYEYESIRGENVTIHGKGFYKHMSSDVAVQGIAQDFVTLIFGVPLLLISLILMRRDLLWGRFLLSGTLAYFMVTYIFYLCMAMYNELFVLWILLASFSFYAFVIAITSFKTQSLETHFKISFPRRTVGGFLIINSILIGLMWLGVVLPPLLDGSIYPIELEHYTTMIVQGLDLSILLPASFLSGFLLIKKREFGYILGPIYMVFLSLLMTALTGKIIGMTISGVDPGPAIIIIPLINLTAIVLTIITLKNIVDEKKGTEGRDHGPDLS
jgi:hypothetical protein